MSGEPKRPQPERAVDLLRRAHELFNRGDYEAIFEVLDEDVEWGTAGRFPGIDPVYSGPAAMTRWAEEIRSVWERFEVRLEEVVFESRERVGVVEHVRGRGRGSGIETEMRFYVLYEVRAGRLARRRAFEQRADLERAACEA